MMHGPVGGPCPYMNAKQNNNVDCWRGHVVLIRALPVSVTETLVQLVINTMLIAVRFLFEH